MATTWQPVELSLAAADPPADPYGDIALSAAFEHESGARHEVPGFPDGGDTWRVRFAPPRPGRWTWETDADDPGLRETGSFEATDGGGTALDEHGHLVAGERALRHDDGTPFFWLADTVWGAGSKATADEWETYLDRRVEQGFTAVQLNALPQHDASRPDDRLPFGADWERDAPDPAYFRALDGLVAAARERGLVPALVALWFDYVPGANEDWGVEPRYEFSANAARRFGRYLAARYGAYGPAWLVSGDSEFNERCLAVYRAAGEALRAGCPHPLLTVHQPGGQVTPAVVTDEGWLDFHMYQSSHTDDLERPARQARDCRALDPPRPVLNGEPCYEGIHNRGADEPVRIDRADVRAAGWVSVLAGGNAGLTYGAHGLWPWHREGEAFAAADTWLDPAPWREALDFPGAGDYARLRALLVDLGVDALDPRPDMVAPDEPGVEAAVLPGAVLAYTDEPRELALHDPPPVEGYAWIDPATGGRTDADVERAGGGVRASSPGDGDALLLGRR